MTTKRQAVDAYDAAIFAAGKYRSARHHFGSGFDAALARAEEIIREKYFGGTTQDMIVGWLERERESALPEEE